MAIYRVKRSLDRGGQGMVPIGSVVRGSEWKPESIKALLAANAIEEVSSPPIEAIPGWKRFTILAVEGVVTIGDFIECPSVTIADLAQTSIEEVELWKARAITLLTPESI